MPSKNKRVPSLLNIILLIIGLGLIGFSVPYLWEWYVRTQGAAPPPTNKTVTFSTDKPDEKKVPPDADYRVAPDQPKKIIIPSISAEGFIQPVGKDQYKKVGVPTNIHFAGWFVGSVKPGDPGLSIIDGHVSSLYGTALFAKLKSLRQNEEVRVQFGDDSVRRFQVVEKRELAESQTAKFLFSKKEGIKQQLNLITCGGSFNKKSDQYNGRLVVVTQRID